MGSRDTRIADTDVAGRTRSATPGLGILALPVAGYAATPRGTPPRGAREVQALRVRARRPRDRRLAPRTARSLRARSARARARIAISTSAAPHPADFAFEFRRVRRPTDVCTTSAFPAPWVGALRGAACGGTSPAGTRSILTNTDGTLLGGEGP